MSAGWTSRLHWAWIAVLGMGCLLAAPPADAQSNEPVIELEPEDPVVDPAKPARGVLIGKPRDIGQLIYALKDKPQVGVIDIPPDQAYSILAQQKLSAVDYQRWQQRVSTVPSDIAISPTLDGLALEFLSADELAEWNAMLAARDPQKYESYPSAWPDIPPATGNRELAAAVFTDPAVLDDWDLVATLAPDRFPSDFVSEKSVELARKVLSANLPAGADPNTTPTPLQAWKDRVAARRIYAPATDVAAMSWTMLQSHPDLRPIAKVVLPAAEWVAWERNIGHVHPYYLGTANGARKFAEAMLDATGFMAWQNNVVPDQAFNWTAFLYRKDSIQRDVVIGIFGGMSADAMAWDQWAAGTLNTR